MHSPPWCKIGVSSFSARDLENKVKNNFWEKDLEPIKRMKVICCNSSTTSKDKGLQVTHLCRAPHWNVHFYLPANWGNLKFLCQATLYKAVKTHLHIHQSSATLEGHACDQGTQDTHKTHYISHWFSSVCSGLRPWWDSFNPLLVGLEWYMDLLRVPHWNALCRRVLTTDFFYAVSDSYEVKLRYCSVWVCFLHCGFLGSCLPIAVQFGE